MPLFKTKERIAVNKIRHDSSIIMYNKQIAAKNVTPAELFLSHFSLIYTFLNDII